MRLLLDTHLVLWWEANHPRLSADAKKLIRAEAESVFVSRASLWEIAIKIANGRLRLDVAKFVRSVEKHGFEWLDIRNEHILAVASLPTFEDHRDPFDRMLVAQAVEERLTLLTADATLAGYGRFVQVV